MKGGASPWTCCAEWGPTEACWTPPSLLRDLWLHTTPRASPPASHWFPAGLRLQLNQHTQRSKCHLFWSSLSSMTSFIICIKINPTAFHLVQSNFFKKLRWQFQLRSTYVSTMGFENHHPYHCPHPAYNYTRLHTILKSPQAVTIFVCLYDPGLRLL